MRNGYKQLDHAHQADNILYKTECAECTSFPDQIFDLITVGQAIHWSDFNAFYKEAKRTLKPGGIIALIGYGSVWGRMNEPIPLLTGYIAGLWGYTGTQNGAITMRNTVLFHFHLIKPKFRDLQILLNGLLNI